MNRTFVTSVFAAPLAFLSLTSPHGAAQPGHLALTPPPTPPVTATVALIPRTRRTPDSIPLLLKIRNNTDISIRLLNLFAQRDLPIVARFHLDGPNLGYLPSPPGPDGTSTFVYRGSGLDYGMKAELCRWQYVYVTVKPHKTFQTRFDLARMTLDKRRIPPGKYKLSGSYGVNMGYPTDKGSGEDVFNGNGDIAPIDLTVDAPDDRAKVGKQASP